MADVHFRKTVLLVYAVRSADSPDLERRHFQQWGTTGEGPLPGGLTGGWSRPNSGLPRAVDGQSTCKQRIA